MRHLLVPPLRAEAPAGLHARRLHMGTLVGRPRSVAEDAAVPRIAVPHIVVIHNAPEEERENVGDI